MLIVYRLPEGYNAIGIRRARRNVSGGERQRLSDCTGVTQRCADIIFEWADRIALDDARTEECYSRNLGDWWKAERPLSSHIDYQQSEKADQIIVLRERTNCRTRGTHTELLANEGLYSSLYEIQFGQQQHQNITGEQQIVNKVT